MEYFQHITSFIWNVADDVLLDDISRSKYPDVIPPFTVPGRIDCVPAPTKENVLQKYNEQKDEIETDIKTPEAEIPEMVKEMMG